MKFFTFCAIGKWFVSSAIRNRMRSISMVLFLIPASLLTCSFRATQPRQYQIDKPSPDGTFRVRTMVKRGEPGKTLDQAKFEFLMRGEVVDSWEWKQEDQYDEDFDSYLPIEWVNEKVLHIGGRVTSSVTFLDELSVTNTSEKPLKYVSIIYRKADIFEIFELPPGGQIILRASPWFTVKGGEFTFGYGGMTQAGKAFDGIVRLGERTYPDRPRKIAITISPEQIQ